MYNLQEFSNYQILYGWGTLLIGLEMGFISVPGACKYAQHYLVDNSHFQNEKLVELAWGNNNISQTMELVRHIIIQTDTVYNLDTEQKKWRLFVLNKIVETEKESDQILEKVAGIYSTFGYPSDMDDLIYYMPSVGTNSDKNNSRVDKVDRLICRLELFIKKEHSLLK